MAAEKSQVSVFVKSISVLVVSGTKNTEILVQIVNRHATLKVLSCIYIQSRATNSVAAASPRYTAVRVVSHLNYM